MEKVIESFIKHIDGKSGNLVTFLYLLLAIGATGAWLWVSMLQAAIEARDALIREQLEFAKTGSRRIEEQKSIHSDKEALSDQELKNCKSTIKQKLVDLELANIFLSRQLSSHEESLEGLDSTLSKTIETLHTLRSSAPDGTYDLESMIQSLREQRVDLKQQLAVAREVDAFFDTTSATFEIPTMSANAILIFSLILASLSISSIHSRHRSRGK